MSTDYKKIFGQKDTFLTSADRDRLASEAESVSYLLEYFNKKQRFIPPVDFSQPKYFARFGAAEKYYIDAIDRIYKTYPYDGSLRERIQWELSSSYLDLHVFENEYPRTNGHVLFSPAGWGSIVGSQVNSFGLSDTAEYIQFKGGPHTSQRSQGKDIRDTSGDYEDGYANVWDTDKKRASNLALDFDEGVTVEFWLKKAAALGFGESILETIFDVWNGADTSVAYGRLQILHITVAPSIIGVYCNSGSVSVNASSPAYYLSLDDQWHHYAISLKNDGSNLITKFYKDGTCVKEETDTTLNEITGSLIANIGAARRPSTSRAETATLSSAQKIDGYGKLSGSIDEFRFWKTERTSQQIGRQMIEPVGGGTNTDDANTTLGVYYKFNEGITLTSSVDKTILDYSGRVSNGTFVGYNSYTRSTNSAMVDSGKVDREFKDPILYSFHPDVAAYRKKKQDEGRDHDYSNNASIYHSMPSWIIEEDEYKENSPLRNLTQIIGSYFDTLASQIESIPKLKHKNYLSSSFKPYPFSDRILESVGFSYFPELFSDATALQHFRNRDDVSLFKQKLYDVKNRIYQNIYNNIVYIYKTKGTEKSFRNLIRCFGFDSEIYKINTYGHRVTHQLKDNYESVAEFKKYANFSLINTKDAVVFPFSSSANYSTSFISASQTAALESTGGLALTMETEVAFPRRHSLAASNTVAQAGTGSSRSFRAYSPFKTASLFGMHQVEGITENNLTWASTDYANFQVYAIKSDNFSQRCQFVLTGTSDSAMPTLSSSYFDGVFDDTRWSFSVAIKPSNYPESTLPSGSAGSAWDVEFYGIEKVLDTTRNEFFVTSSISAIAGTRFMTNPKSVYIGAHRTNFSGSVLQSSDGNISSTRVWMTHLPTGAIQQHAQDVSNYGTPNPYKSAYLYQTTMTGTRVPEIHTLALNWVFDTLSSSDANGEFVGHDFSSGSAGLQNRYNWLGNIIGKQYLPKGYGFPTNSSSSINRKYIYSAKKQLPEMVNSSDMVNVLTDDDKLFNSSDLARPTNYYTYIEKSMYQTISEEMIRIFSSIKDFNNLIGEPVNKYRDKYKHMEKLRQIFFERVNNTPDLDKYIDFYKWVDQTLDSLLGDLVPASADISDQYGSNIRTLVESHVLERNKYKWQFPTLEDKTPSAIEGRVLGINELTYNWEYGHAPIYQFANQKSIAFNGVDGESQLTVGDGADLSFGATGGPFEPSFSFTAWIKPDSTLTHQFTIVSKSNSGPPSEYLWYISGTTLYFWIRDNSSTNSFYAYKSGVLTMGQWNHVCVTYDGTKAPSGINFYVNGVSVGVTGTNTLGTYVAMENTAAEFIIGRLYSNLTTKVAEGLIDEVAAFKKELTDDEVTEIYNSRRVFNLETFSDVANLVSWWRMGNKATGTSPDYTIPDQIGSNDAIMSSFLGDSTSGVVSDSAPPSVSTAEKCLWWDQRAERSNALTSGDTNVDDDKQTILDSIVNETNANDYTLYDNDTNTSYSGSTYAIRRLAKPYKLDARENRIIKGGINFHPNKKVDITRTETNVETSENFLAAAAANVESFKDCNDGLGLVTKRKYSFNTLLRSELETATEKNYFNTKGALFSPFSMYSASISGGYYDEISNNFKTTLDITNLHEDSYGTLYGVPVQGPFTEKHVGGLQYRHIALTVDPTQTGSANRPEGWSLSFNNNILTMSGPGQGTEGSRPKAMRLRDETAKRPVNIRNIQQATGSKILGNYNKDYEILMTAGRSINNRYFTKNEGVSASSISSVVISGAIDYSLPGTTQSQRGRQEVVINGLTSTARNDYIIVNRFSAPGDPSTMGFAFLDIESQEYSVYNALPWRNLIVRESLHELLTDHTKQFGYFSDTQNSASYALAGATYPGSSGSVSALNYDSTASFHKVNRNPRNVIKFDGASDNSYLTGTVYDNWYVQHQIPQTDLQYQWITSSVIENYTGPAYYGFEKPDFSNASLASTDITFISASATGAFGINFDFVGLNTLIYDPLTSSSNTLSASNNDYRNISIESRAASPDDFNSLILHRQGPYGWPSWKQTRGYQNPIIRVHKKENRHSFAKTIPITMDDILGPLTTNLAKIHSLSGWLKDGGRSRDVLVSQIEPPLTSKFKPITHNLQIKTSWSETPDIDSIKIRHAYGNEKTNFTQKVSGSIDLDKAKFIYVNSEVPGQLLSQKSKILVYDSLHRFIENPSIANPIEEFINLEIEETIYPREHYTHLKSTRQRDNFINSFWRDSRTNRNQDLGYTSANSQGKTVSQSMWPLDGRQNTDAIPLTASAGYEGELQNSYSLFFSGNNPSTDFTASAAAATYNRRIPESMPTEVIYAGDTAWEANTQAGINPFYNNYASYVEELKRAGKDYGIVPEFRISEHMEYYVNDQQEDFMEPNPGYLTLTGSTISSSNDNTFYTVYTYSDFMKYFKVVQSDYSQYAIPTELTLECEALIKFLPYDGFYPAQRTVQLAQLFSQSYGPSASLKGDSGSWRTMMAPFFAPGLLYNSIKSGIAVDYPVATASLGHNLFITGSEANSTADAPGASRLSGAFDFRLPFEALIAPDDIAGFGQVIDTEPHPSASIDSTASFDGETTPLYKYAMNNFLAEVPSFFLKDGGLSSLSSKSDLGDTITCNPNKDYKMRIVCRNGRGRYLEQLQTSGKRTLQTASFIYNPPAVTMYNRSFNLSSLANYQLRHVGEYFTTLAYGSSFGPPCDAAYHNGTMHISESSFEPFTPPYYNGYSHIELTFRSGQDGETTIPDLVGAIKEENMSSFRETTRESGSRGLTTAGLNGMPFSASFNYKQVVTDVGNKWVIQPKWECPILNFNNSDITLPTAGSGSVAKGMWHQYSSVLPRGGSSVFLSVQDVPGHPQELSLRTLLGYNRNNSTVRLGELAEEKTIREAVIAIPFWPDEDATTTAGKNYFNIDPRTVEWALLEIEKQKGGKIAIAARQKIQQLYYTEYGIDVNMLEYKPAKSVIDMIKAMQKYVIPPQFNFLREGNQKETSPGQGAYTTPAPIAMFIFEYETTLTRKDLLNIWQNLPPNDPNGPTHKRSLSRAVTKQVTAPFSWGHKEGLNLLKRKDLLVDSVNNNSGDWKGHDLLNERPGEGTQIGGSEGMGGNPSWQNNTNLPFPHSIQWMVFKVKQKAKTNYYDLTATENVTIDPEANTAVTEVGYSDIPHYSYNWPYDFFSLVELVKLNTAYKIEKNPTTPYTWPSPPAVEETPTAAAATPEGGVGAFGPGASTGTPADTEGTATPAPRISRGTVGTATATGIGPGGQAGTGMGPGSQGPQGGGNY